MLPMIDVNFSKENALPFDLWGLIYHDWKPTPEEGVTVFLQGLEKRGDNNLRKQIYFSGVTPDLYKPTYAAKVAAFFDKLLDQQFANRPFMRHYLDYYFDLYWDLHLGVTGDDIPFEVRQIGEAFNTVLAYRNPLPIVPDQVHESPRAPRSAEVVDRQPHRRYPVRQNQESGKDHGLVLAEECRGRQPFQQEGRGL